jgi:hypothetical protein
MIPNISYVDAIFQILYFKKNIKNEAILRFQSLKLKKGVNIKNNNNNWFRALMIKHVCFILCLYPDLGKYL